MKVVYIAGLNRANSAWEIEQNIREAEKIALHVWANGMVALCPHTQTRLTQGFLPDALWLAGDLELLAAWCDAVFLVPGWESSRGTMAEVNFAKSKGIPRFVTLMELERWNKGSSSTLRARARSVTCRATTSPLPGAHLVAVHPDRIVVLDVEV